MLQKLLKCLMEATFDCRSALQRSTSSCSGVMDSADEYSLSNETGEEKMVIF